jgi:prolyl 4-hydroxylase
MAGALGTLTVAWLSRTFLLEWIVCDDTPDIGLKEIPGVLTPEECNELIAWKNTHKERSTESKIEKWCLWKFNKVNTRHRKSSQCWIYEDEHPLVRKLQSVVAQHISYDYNCNTKCDYEALQIAHYKTGGYFKPHYDIHLNPLVPQYRTGTLIVYLNDDYVGGETRFPYLNRTIRPKKGDAIFFYSIHVNSKDKFKFKFKKPLWYSKHEGCEVRHGEKYIATLWFNEKI